MNSRTIILGIDPGIERVGIAILAKDKDSNPKEKLIHSECFFTDKKLETHKRLTLIYDHITNVIHEFKPDIASVEKIFFATNAKTAVIVAEARGAILSALGKEDVNVMELSPTEIKESITGNGRASKDDIKRMLPKIIELIHSKSQDDELDAIASALAASSKLRYSQL